jgi:RHS repeat-associated protein
MLQKIIHQILPLLLLLLASRSYGQISLSGATKINSGGSSTYTAANHCTSTGVCWSSTGTLTGGSGGGPAPDVAKSPMAQNVLASGSCSGASSNTVNWPTVTVLTTGNVQVVNNCLNSALLSVTIVPPLNSGITISPASESVFCGSAPGILTASTPSGGDNTYGYTWQYSNDNSTWTTITGTSGGSYQPSVNSALYYRVIVTSFDYSVTSSVATINTGPAPFGPGTISNTAQTIIAGNSPATINCSLPTGAVCVGTPVYSSMWESSIDGVFYDATGVTTQNYSPGPLSVTTYFYRQDTYSQTTPQGTLITVVHSNAATVTVVPPLSSGTISGPAFGVNTGTTAYISNTVSAAGDTCNTSPNLYSWWQSSDGTNFTQIAGINSPDYTTPLLTAPVYYRREATCGPTILSSNIVEVTVYPPLTAGTLIPVPMTVPPGSDPGLLTANPATGGNCSGSYSYQWQQSTDGVNFTTATDSSTGQNYDPGVLTAAGYFRRRVVCGTDTLYTNVASIIIGTAAGGNLNYVRTRTITKPLVTDTVTADGLTSPVDVQQTTQYIDGLGRSVQTVTRQISPLGKDMVLPQVYDPFGRETIHYLPYVSPSSDGNYKPNALAEQNSFNSTQYPGEQFYYGQTDYEASPLNRTLTTYSAGANWVGGGRGIGNAYEANTPQDSVVIWNITAAPGSLPTMAGRYSAGQLYKNVTTDENGQQVIQYKDKEGQVILKKVQLSPTPGTAHIGWLCTYYVYDVLNNLRFVLSPQVVGLINTGGTWTVPPGIANELCFRYEYDYRNRMNIKKVPGAGEVHMVYDQRDRLVMSQDSNMRANKQWLVTSYDVQDRPDSSGLITDPTNYNNLSYHTAAAMATTPYPTISGYTYSPLTQTHYDDYAWVSTSIPLLGATMDTSYDSSPSVFFQSYSASPYAVHQTPFMITRGMVTGTKQYLLGTTTAQYTVDFYDDRSRILEVKSTNYTSGNVFDRDIYQYNFSGKLLRHLLVQEKGSPIAYTSLQNDQYTYDAAFRETAVTMAYLNGYSFTIDTLRYDELGRLHTKSLGGRMDSLVYDYNIRGWLTGINKNYVAGTGKDYFGMELAYDNKTSVSTTSYAVAQYNGNITGLIWKSAGDGTNRKYDFQYDNANRLTAANFLQNPTGSTWNTAAMDYSVSGLAYDGNGNILSMNQKGFKVGAPTGAIDQLTYGYQTTSNKLSQVTDAANDTASTLGDFHYKSKGAYDYTYDGNGNLKIDNNKGIDSIGYNYLNLPQYIHIKGKGTITYAYDATGLKEAKITVDSTVSPARTTKTVYIKNFQYINDTLAQASVEDGRARWQKEFFLNGDSIYRFNFDYFLKDHLGNTRVILTTEKDTAQYMATMEAAYRAKERALFYNIDSTSYPAALVPGGYPTDGTTVPNDSVARVSGSTGSHTMGPALLLKVMSGDSVAVGVKSYYVGGGSAGSTSSSLPSILNSLAGGLVALSPVGHGAFSALDASPSGPVYTALNNFLPSKDSTPTGKPKAYLNWMLLDNQFNYVSGNNQSGAVPVGSANVLNTLATNIKLQHSGYLYIWVSNETQNWDVFFDNLSVEDFSGPLLEEDHYYPFGLTMAGISDKALKSQYTENRYRYNGIEYDSAFGLDEYEAQYRDLDPQTGRWWQIDPQTEGYENVSPYASMYDDPTAKSDPLGDEAEEASSGGGCCQTLINDVKAFVAVTNVAAQITGKKEGEIGRNVLVNAGGVAQGTLSAITGGLISPDPIFADGYTEDDLSNHSGGAMAGQLVAMLADGVPGTSSGSTMQLAPVSDMLLGFKPIEFTPALPAARVDVHGNSANSNAPSGNYTNTHKSGKTYDGVGDKKRMDQSAKNVAKNNNDPVASQSWKGAPNKKTAYIREHKAITKHGGAGNTKKNYNVNNSPGKKLSNGK